MSRTLGRFLVIAPLMSLLSAGCDSLLAGGDAPGAGNGSGGAQGSGGTSASGGATVTPPSGSGGSSPTQDAAVTPIDAAADTVVGPPVDPAKCEYPAGAPTLAISRFTVGSIVPNLTFTRENGQPLSFKYIHCEKKNRLLYWAIGGDQCGPCIGTAKEFVVPAWKELASEGLFIMEGFNGRGYLVSQPPKNPFAAWRGFVPTWPPDGEMIALVQEPSTMPYYYVGRVVSLVVPDTIVIDVATMKVLYVAYHWKAGIPGLRAQLASLPPRM